MMSLAGLSKASTPDVAAASSISRSLAARFFAFVGWWKAGLSADLPPSLRRLFFGDPRVLRLSGTDPRTVFLLPSLDASIDQGRALNVGSRTFRRLKRSLPVVLQTSSHHVLIKSFALPRAAFENLDGALRYGLSRWTPFNGDEVYAGLVRKADAGDNSSSAVELRLIPRFALTDEPAHGITVDFIDLGEGALCWTDAGAKKRERQRRAGYLDAVLAIATVLLCALLLVLATTAEDTRVSQISEAIRGEVELARQAAQLKSEIELERARADFLRKEEADRVPLSLLFNTIAEALPPEAVLRELTWNGRQGSIVVDALVERPVELDLSESGLSTLVTPVPRAGTGDTGVAGQSASWSVQIEKTQR